MSWPATSPVFGTYDWFALNVGNYIKAGFNFKAWDYEVSSKVCLLYTSDAADE